jgi:hypothetical protein
MLEGCSLSLSTEHGSAGAMPTEICTPGLGLAGFSSARDFALDFVPASGSGVPMTQGPEIASARFWHATR